MQPPESDPLLFEPYGVTEPVGPDVVVEGGAENDPAVVGDVEPSVSVGCHGICTLDTAQERSRAVTLCRSRAAGTAQAALQPNAGTPC